MADTPSNDDLRAIQRAMPGVMKEHREKKKNDTLKKLPPNSEICRICTSTYTKIISKENQRNICPDCATRLSNGQTALMCVTGRHAFIQPDNDPQAQKLAGQVIAVKIETMDAIFAKQADKAKEN